MRFVRFVAAGLAAFLFFSCGRLPVRQEVTEEQAAAALAYTVDVIGSPYEWAGNGPDEFDCSGLIVRAYREVLGAEDIFYDGAGQVADVNMQTFFDYNVRHIEASGAVPGDIIFITTEEGVITHGGLVEEVAATEVTFINASSYYDAVIRDTWPLEEDVRGQWIAGFGRLVIFR